MPLLAGYNKYQTVFHVNAGSAVSGTTILPIMRAPFGGMTIVGAWAAVDTAVAANASNYVTLNLFNAGTAGTATVSSGTVGGTAGLTVAPTAFTIDTTLDEFTEGQYLNLKVGKIGSITEREFSVIVDWVHGKG